MILDPTEAEPIHPDLLTFFSEPTLENLDHPLQPIALSDEDRFDGLKLFTENLLPLSPVDQVSVISDAYQKCFNILSNKLKEYLCFLVQISNSSNRTWEQLEYNFMSQDPLQPQHLVLLDNFNQNLHLLAYEFDTYNKQFQIVSDHITLMNLKYDFLMYQIQQDCEDLVEDLVEDLDEEDLEI